MYRDDQARCILIVWGSVHGCWRGLGNMINLTLTSIKRGFTIVAPGFDIVQTRFSCYDTLRNSRNPNCSSLTRMYLRNFPLSFVPATASGGKNPRCRWSHIQEMGDGRTKCVHKRGNKLLGQIRDVYVTIPVSAAIL